MEKNGYDVQGDYVEAELYMTPQAMSYECQITVTIDNITSAYAANAALYGFVGSAFMSSRMPSHFYVTHQLKLNNKKMLPEGDDRGTIESPVFVTFGPPVDVPDKKYEVYLNITLIDNTTFEHTEDVTDQVLPVINSVKNNLAGVEHVEYRITIPLAIEIELPFARPVEGIIGMDDWEDDEIIRFPITQ